MRSLAGGWLLALLLHGLSAPASAQQVQQDQQSQQTQQVQQSPRNRRALAPRCEESHLQVTLGIPSDLAFAVPGPPKGRLTVPFTSDLVTVAGQSRFTPQSLQTFEAGLRQALWTAAQQNARQPLAAGRGGR